MKPFFSSLFIFFCTFIMSSNVSADRGNKPDLMIRMNGTKTVGYIQAMDDQYIRYKSQTGKVRLARDKVKRIVFGNGHVHDLIPHADHTIYSAPVTFVFYSSTEDEMFVAGDFNNWSKTETPMTRKGNRFICTVNLTEGTAYKFFSARKYHCFYNYDPFNSERRGNNPYITLKSNEPTTNENPLVKFQPTKWVDYFTLGDPRFGHLLNEATEVLATKILSFFANDLAPSRDKIRYMHTFHNGTFAIHGSSEIIEKNPFLNTHEIIHCLMNTPKVGAFAEGFAQCFQLSGNNSHLPALRKFGGDANPSQSLRKRLKKRPDLDINWVIANFDGGKYHEMASFVFWSCFVDRENLTKFVHFTRDLHGPESLDEMNRRYQSLYGYDLKEASKRWMAWLRRADSRQTNVPWALGKAVENLEILPPAKDSASYQAGRLLLPFGERTQLTVENSFSAHCGWGSVKTNQRCKSGPLTTAGQVYKKGIGTHANSEIVYRLNGQFYQFSAKCGVDDCTVNDQHRTSVTFKVLVDGQVKFNSGVMRYGETPKKIAIDLRGARELKLIVTDAGDSAFGDHANWLETFLF